MHRCASREIIKEKREPECTSPLLHHLAFKVQAEMRAAPLRRRRAAPPTRPKPASIIAQLAGSGMPDMTGSKEICFTSLNFSDHINLAVGRQTKSAENLRSAADKVDLDVQIARTLIGEILNLELHHTKAR